MYIADTVNMRIRKVTVSTGIISTYAGSSTIGSFSGDNDQATSATFYDPVGIAIDLSGSFIYYEERFNFTIYYYKATCTSRMFKITVSAR